MDLNVDSIKKSVRGFLVESFFLDEESNPFQDNDSFLDLGIIDSTGILEVISFIEETYSITIEDSEMLPEKLDSLDNISQFVISKVSN